MEGGECDLLWARQVCALAGLSEKHRIRWWYPVHMTRMSWRGEHPNKLSMDSMVLGLPSALALTVLGFLRELFRGVDEG